MSDMRGEGTPQTSRGEDGPRRLDAAAARSRRKVRDGVVVGDKMEKTVVVLVQDLKPHPLYKKVVRASRRFNAHDEGNSCRVGDRVRIMETRPLSKQKRWRVCEILEKAK